MNKGKKLIEDLFGAIIGQYPRIKLGYGSFVTMDFGRDIPEEIKTRRGIEITYFGEWHFWIYMCAWRIDLSGNPYIGSDDDRKAIEEKLLILNEKKLLEFSVLSPSFDVLLKFECEYELRLFSFNTTENEQWMLYTPEKKVFTAGPGSNWQYKDSKS